MLRGAWQGAATADRKRTERSQCGRAAAQHHRRQLAIDELLSGLSAWLEVSLERVDSDEVCGCHCGNAALSKVTASCLNLWMGMRRNQSTNRL